MESKPKSELIVVFGAMTFGRKGSPEFPTSHAQTRLISFSGGEQSRVHDLSTGGAILDIFRQHGHREVDTARAYGEGSSETMLGDLNWQDRGLIMQTKFHATAGRQGARPATWSAELQHTPQQLRENLMISLKSLKTDKLDLWYLHTPDRTVPYEVTLKAVDELYQEGYFKRFGISNYQSWEVAQICELCRANGWKQPDVYQGIYNALHRGVEPELFPCLRYYGIAFYAYNPLAGGYLTSRYQRKDLEGDVEEGSRFDRNRWQGKSYRWRYFHEEYFDALDILRPVAAKHGLTEGECALRWMNHHSSLKKEHGDAIINSASSVKVSCCF